MKSDKCWFLMEKQQNNDTIRVEIGILQAPLYT